MQRVRCFRMSKQSRSASQRLLVVLFRVCNYYEPSNFICRLLALGGIFYDEDIYAQVTTTPEVIQGPVTRARARELNYVLLLSNQGPAEG